MTVTARMFERAVSGRRAAPETAGSVTATVPRAAHAAGSTLAFDDEIPGLQRGLRRGSSEHQVLQPARLGGGSP